ncbi:MAG: serine/threonine-protein kinase [Planctomycetota bacterium]
MAGPDQTPPDDESVVELDLAEVEAFLERVGSGGREPEVSVDGDESSEEPSGSEDAPRSKETARSDETPHAEESTAPPAAVDDPPSETDTELPRDRPRIAGYRILGVVGRGATGVVYRARQEAVDRKVALKVLHRELITNSRAVRRLQREARLAAKLAHPSIISAIDMGEIDGLWWYAMELVEGVPLSRRIAERGSLTEREVLRLFSPLCDALQHAHEVGVVHRDIKPANVLIDGRGRARLVDLGLAMGQNDPSITRTGSTLGTPHYVSPEQARDPSQADIRSDLWSVGATMYHAATGQPPFHAEAAEDGGVAEILSRVLYEPVVDPRELAPTLSKGFALMLRKCLTRDPAQRYQEPWELVADIELLRERRRLDLRGSQLDAFASRRPPWVGRAAAGVALALTIAGTWAITARPWEARPDPVIVQREVTLADWPQLEAIADRFDTREITHAEALAELDSPGLLTLPESALGLRSGLVLQVKDDLTRVIDDVLGAAEADVERHLRDRDFDQAEAACGERLDAILRARTGFVDIAALPAGTSLLHAEQWRNEERKAVGAARRGAVREAREALRRAYPVEVTERVDALVAEGRWRDASELLEVASDLDWLELPGARLDLRGLRPDELEEVARAVENLARSDRALVNRTAFDAVREARAYLESERERHLLAIRQDRVKDANPAALRLECSLEAKHATLSLTIEQLPSPYRSDYRAEVQETLRDIDRQEALRRELLARRGLRDLEREARPMLLDRRYDDARSLYRSARADAWRSTTFDVLDGRLRELDLLDGVLARAAAGVAARNRESVELRFARIPVRGRILANRADTLRLGFQLRPERASAEPLVVVFRASPSAERGSERVLEVDDVLRFAGLRDAGALEPADRLAAAAFLAAEGRPGEAHPLVRLEDHPATDPLPADLEKRVRPSLDAGTEAPSSGDDSDPAGRAERATGVAAPVAPPSFEEVFGVPNQTDLPHKVQLVWRFSDDSTFGGDLIRELPSGRKRHGAWTSRGWTLRPTGFTLDADLTDHADFLEREIGPTLALAEPLREDRRITVRLELTPGDARPDGHLVALSVRGFHLLLVDRQFRDELWFGTGSFRTLYDHVVRGDASGLDDFHRADFVGLEDGATTEIELELRKKKLELLRIGGVEIDLPAFYAEPRRPDAAIRLRSRKSMVLSAAEIRGERR